MAEEELQCCRHPTVYQRILQTERFYVLILRCNLCAELVRVETKTKENRV